MRQINDDLFTMPLLALRGLSVFPGMLLTFDVERPASVSALGIYFVQYFYVVAHYC